MIKLVFKIFICLELAVLLFLWFGTVTVPYRLCQPFIKEIKTRSQADLTFDTISFNLRHIKLNQIQIKKDQHSLLKADSLAIYYHWAQLFQGNILSGRLVTESLQTNIPIFNLKKISIERLNIQFTGTLHKNAFVGETYTIARGIHANSPSIFLTKLGTFIRLKSFEALSAENFSLNMMHDNVQWHISEISAYADDFNLEGDGIYRLQEDVDCNIKLEYQPYIPGRPQQKSGRNHLSFRVYGPQDKLGYRITA